MIKKIERYSLVDEAYKRIKEEVLSDKFSEGDLIPSENALSKALSVSRVVIREALSKLRSERIIVTYQGMGSFKSNPKNFLNYSVGQKEVTLEKFKEITEFRGVIENGAILSAVKNASDEELNKVLLCAEKMALAKDDADAFNIADYEFHLAVLNCSHNSLFVAAVESLKDSVMTALKAMNDLDGGREWAIDLHKKIALRLIDRDAKGAIDLLKNNGEYNLARMSEIF